MKHTYYNDIDAKTCAWLAQLANEGHISNGVVHCGSIKDITPEQLRGYKRAHFFAGIGGWDYALRLAGWPDDRPVWTGSCPCQPFSSAGKRQGQADERHLWPDWFRLIRECRPDCILGEQVASAIGHGWLDGVFADLESEGYTCGAVVLGAHSVGAPHIRQRLWWVADAKDAGCSWRKTGNQSRSQRKIQGGWQENRRLSVVESAGCCDDGGLSNSVRAGLEAVGQITPRACAIGPETVGGVDDTKGIGRVAVQPANVGAASREEHALTNAGDGGDGTSWSRCILIPCGDGKTRRLEPGVSPLVDGVPARVVRLRGYGNAIVPACAAAFITAFMECEKA